MEEKPKNQPSEGFSPVVIDHARNPRNVGEIPGADGYASAVGSCGDLMEMWLKIRGDTVLRATFSTTGCGPTIATLSFVTELARSKTIAEIKSISPESILDALGGLPEENVECAVLAVTILKQALRDYLAYKNEPWKRMYRPRY